VLGLGDRAGSDHDLGFAGEDRSSNCRDVPAEVLVIRIRVDDDICSEKQAGLDAGHKSLGKAAIHGVPHDMVNPQLPSDFGSVVSRTIVDDKPLHTVEPIDSARQIIQCDAERIGLIEAGDLNDQFQSPYSPWQAPLGSATLYGVYNPVVQDNKHAYIRRAQEFVIDLSYGECMRRVLFISRKWPPAIGGMETYALKLVAELASRCHLITRVLPGRAHGSPPGLPRLAIFLIGSLGFLLRRRADVVHIGDLVLWPLALAAHVFGTAPRVVITAYGLDVIYGRRRGLLPKVYGLYLRLGVRLVARRVRIIAISNETARLCRAAGFSDVVVVTLGVDLPATAPAEENVPGNYVLFVGRLVRRKGAAWFASEVLPRLPASLRMVVVGKAWDLEELAVLEANPRVEYQKVVSAAQLLTLRRSAVVVVMPNVLSSGNDIEGFGLTAVEAGADGGVLLASGIEGIVDAVVDGTTGFLLPAGDAAAWAAKVDDVFGWSPQRRSEFIHACQAEVARRYTWSAVANQTLDAYGASQEDIH
jgi:phosphatidyl-myo-inositol dimannoside synthase